jgi:hypothetical protein
MPQLFYSLFFSFEFTQDKRLFDFPATFSGIVTEDDLIIVL